MEQNVARVLPHRNEEPIQRPDILAKIREKSPVLSKSLQKTGDYILAHPGEVTYLSITELAEKANVSEATVSRFCLVLGMQGFQGLKIALAHANAFSEGFQRTSQETPQVGSLASNIAERITRVVNATIQSINEHTVDKTCELLAAARKIDFYGIGTSGVMALDASQMFLGIGKLTTAYADPHIQVMSAAHLGEADVAVAFTHSGATKDTVTALRRARESGAHTICITSYALSPITRVSDLVLLASFGEKVVFTSSYSKIGEMVLLELLYAGCLQKMGIDAQAALERTTSAVLDKLY